jgi:hypothetical protein
LQNWSPQFLMMVPTSDEALSLLLRNTVRI